MPKHKSEDYKISAVHYYIENETSFTETCRIFKCSERSLKRLINRYKIDKSIKRHSRKAISYPYEYCFRLLNHRYFDNV